MVLKVVSIRVNAVEPHFFEEGGEGHEGGVSACPPGRRCGYGFGPLPILFQQVGAPAHGSKLVQDSPRCWFKSEWPARSPDLNPVDFFVWNELQRNACKERLPDKDTLKLAILRAAAHLDQATVDQE